MNATEARKITKDNLENVIIKKYIKHINNRILKESKTGHNSVHNPQVGSADEGFSFYLSIEELNAVRMYYERKGFTWKESPDQDPGHPCSGPYITLIW